MPPFPPEPELEEDEELEDRYGAARCEACGERFTGNPNSDEVAEMYDPDSDVVAEEISGMTIFVHPHHIVHFGCGDDRGWALA